MRCPFCRHGDSRVLDSREQDEGVAIRRRRSCQKCGRRFTTLEETTLSVVKRDGTSEPFSRAKVVSGVRRACQGRPVDDDAISRLAQHVEDTVRADGAAEVPSNEVGLAILGPLRQLDEVAYLRFASVYDSFSSAADFEKAIAVMRAERRDSERTDGHHRPPAGPGSPPNAVGGAGAPPPPSRHPTGSFHRFPDRPTPKPPGLRNERHP